MPVETQCAAKTAISFRDDHAAGKAAMLSMEVLIDE